ncbi:DJ-1/PfpI family protein [Phyllobacterium endophyticum]|uniref:AraC family transcriptional regulator n=1 Tax=Phyllobacterium endophyticum TaxID=1149773 RepID=A0A2P7ASS8_9HYPH|nr:DJ-1/PfpI family protein [Phyllobacterium endophyticum]MBB3236705.1 cyclohexyl-isocyanide hydratase [Phyllobacterium endophyticum]PSH57279.1 AraC family transcriptional regulator [Phyllobacterium endophyticum]TYR39685.1 DJ-1/PfpI family protein [Phyllobacterium endophyticum]
MPFKVGFLIFPMVQQLDLTGPYEVFATAEGIDVELIWKHKNPVPSATGIPLQATKTFSDIGQLDVLIVPGGEGTGALLSDEETLEFIRSQAKAARYTTSVCTGALVLGAAGLLKGKRATTHWYFLDYLKSFGAIPVSERVVTQGSIVSAAGVSAGIDFAFSLLEETVGRDEAETVQLWLEYAPHPPFHSGNPQEASRHRVEATGQRYAFHRRGLDDLFDKLALMRP